MTNDELIEALRGAALMVVSGPDALPKVIILFSDLKRAQHLHQLLATLCSTNS